MALRSSAEADHVLNAGNPRNGGGPVLLNSTESTYTGCWFLVDLTGRPFEFPASAASVDGAAGLFTSKEVGFGSLLNRLVESGLSAIGPGAESVVIWTSV